MYRGVCLLAIISRILARILGTRIARHLEATKQLQNFQWGFRAGHGCRDAILVLRIMCEMIADVDFAVEHNESIISRYSLAPAARSRLVELQSFLDEHRPFVYLADIKKAFPRTPRTLTWTGLAKREVPPKLISVMKRLHEKNEYTVRLPVGDSETYFLKQSVREGCPSSPIVFVAHRDNGLQEIHEEIEGTFIESKSGLRCRGWAPVGDSVEYNLNCIGFADDTTTIGKVKDKQHVIDTVRRILSTNGEEVHLGKDEFLIPCKYVDPSLHPDTNPLFDCSVAGSTRMAVAGLTLGTVSWRLAKLGEKLNDKSH